MKLKKIIILFFCSFFFSCHKQMQWEEAEYIQNIGKEYQNEWSEDKNEISFEQLKQKSTNKIQKYEEDEVLNAIVISSDKTGNIYKKIYLQSVKTSENVVLSVDKKGYFAQMPIGSLIKIRLKDLSFWHNENMNVVEIGYREEKTESGYDKLEPIPYAVFKNITKISDKKVEKTYFTHNLIGLSFEKDKYLNKILIISDVFYDITSVGDTFYNQKDKYSTIHYLKDSQNNRIAVSTSAYSSFANENVPKGFVSVTAILVKNYGRYSLLIVE